MVVMEVSICKVCGGYMSNRMPWEDAEQSRPKLDDRGLWVPELYCPVCEGVEVKCPTCGTQVRKDEIYD